MICLVIIVLTRLIQLIYPFFLFFIVKYLFGNKMHSRKLISASREEKYLDIQTEKMKIKLKEPF